MSTFPRIYRPDDDEPSRGEPHSVARWARRRIQRRGLATWLHAAAVDFVAFVAVCMTTHAAVAECHVDPLTGREVCTIDAARPTDAATQLTATDREAPFPGYSFDSSSGALIYDDGELGIVLTCGHAVRNTAPPYRVRFNGDDQWRDAKLLDVDLDNELAALEIAGGTGRVPMPIDADGPLPRVVCALGFGDATTNYRLAKYAGQVTNVPYDKWRSFAGSIRQGDSGGPVYTREGRLVGVLWGNFAQTREVLFCCNQPLKRFLDRIWPNRPARIIRHADTAPRGPGRPVYAPPYRLPPVQPSRGPAASAAQPTTPPAANGPAPTPPSSSPTFSSAPSTPAAPLVPIQPAPAPAPVAVPAPAPIVPPTAPIVPPTAPIVSPGPAAVPEPTPPPIDKPAATHAPAWDSVYTPAATPASKIALNVLTAVGIYFGIPAGVAGLVAIPSLMIIRKAARYELPRLRNKLRRAGDRQQTQTAPLAPGVVLEDPAQLTIVETPPAKVRQEFVRVPMRDYMAEGYRRAIAAELKQNDHHRPVFDRIQQAAEHIADSLKTDDRIFGGTRPGDIVVKQETQP